MDFTSKDYLPNTEERINNLRRIINNRPVGILAAGPSIVGLEKTVSELPDICWMGLNHFIQETYILLPVGKKLSIFFDSCRESIPIILQYIRDFLARGDDNIFISSFFRDAFAGIDLNTFPNPKLLFFTSADDRTVPNERLPLHFIGGNSLQMAIQIAIVGKASRVILFGADGGYKAGATEYYYHQKDYSPSNYISLAGDTSCFNAVMPDSLKNTYALYNIKPIEILNCSPDSFYTTFPKICYNELKEILKKG